MTNGERESYWRQIVARQEKSGLSAKAFCEQERLCAHTLYIWRKRIAKKQPVSFAVVNVRAEPQRQSAPLELVLRGGDRLQIPGGCDTAILRVVLAALRERE